MSEIAADSSFLRHEVPCSAGQRFLLVCAGLSVIVVAFRGLWAGAYPLGGASPIFLVILSGSVAVGLVVILAGIFGTGDTWDVRPGAVEISRRNLLRSRSHLYPTADIASLAISKVDWDSRPPTFRVVLTTRSGRSYSTRDQVSLEAATTLRNQIEAIYGAQG